jgi:hypothetical protein
MMDSKSAKIRDLNDAFRRTFRGGRIMLTSGVEALPNLRGRLLFKVSRFSDFTADNDPYGEHDFGVVEEAGKRFFWKIDYYDRALEFGSDEPSDPAKTTRVLTLMLAEEY